MCVICGFTLCITRNLFYHYFGKKAIAKKDFSAHHLEMSGNLHEEQL